MPKARVSPTTLEVLRGNDDLSTWDDEELLHGRRRDRRGSFRGAPPKLIPAKCQTELTRRRLNSARELLERNLEEGIQVLVTLMKDPRVRAEDRLKAATFLIERVMGKATEKIDVSVEAPWVAALNSIVVVGDEADVVDVLDVESEEVS